MGELKKSGICIGYGLGPSCAACCIVDATVCQRNKEFESNFDMFFTLCDGQWTSDNGIYAVRKEKFFKNLEETTQRFKELESGGDIARVLRAFQKTDRYAPQDCTDPEGREQFWEEFFKKAGFVGLIDGKAGCLLRAKHSEYLHTECKAYTCYLVSAAEQNPGIHLALKAFIEQERPDSFMYSRIIHILAHHAPVHPALKISRNNLTLAQLLSLKEFVEKKSGFGL